MNRLFLYSGLFFILLLIFDAYDRDYNQIQIANTESAEDVAPQTSSQPPDERSLTSVDTDKEVNKNRKRISATRARKSKATSRQRWTKFSRPIFRAERRVDCSATRTQALAENLAISFFRKLALLT